MITKPSKIANEDFGNRLTEQQCMAMTSKAMERFAQTFERSAKRWEMIIYPAMIVIVALAGYGFYQVYTVARDVRAMVATAEPQMGVHLTRLTLSMQQLTDNISKVTESINTMQRNVGQMSGNIKTMSGDINTMTSQINYLQSMDLQMRAMNRSMNVMAGNTSMMRYDMANMNQSIGKPMNFMNSFMPW